MFAAKFGLLAAQDRYRANVVALLHCNGTNGSTTFTDSSPLGADWTGSNATISTTQSKFGGASMSVAGTQTIGATAASSNFALGTSEFTIELWCYASSFSGTQILYDQRPSAASGFYPTIFLSAGIPVYFTNSTNRIVSGAALSTSTWHHIAVSRVAGNTRMFVDGTQVGSTYVDSDNLVNSSGRPMLADSQVPGSFNLNGFIDEARVTKGVGRYSANFTAPTAPFPNI
jgi:hypothetical protein